MNDYLRPTAPIAADVLLPSDPAVAMALARVLIEQPLMANHSFGLWGYSGTTPQGRRLTIQSTGIGGPSACAVLGDLVAHGTRRVIRVESLAGTSAATNGGPVVISAALAGDGTSRALGAGVEIEADVALSARLLSALGPAARSAKILSSDLNGAGADGPLGAGVVGRDLATAAVFARARQLEVAAAASFAVLSEDPGEGDGPLHPRLLELGEAAVAALSY